MTTKTKFRLIETADEITLILEDGGIACIRQADPLSALDDTCPNRQSTADYYQRRINTKDYAAFKDQYPDSDIWTYLAEGKMYYDDWDVPFNSTKPFREALAWLGYDILECVQDDSLFTEINF